jgi:hypothetical protein
LAIQRQFGLLQSCTVSVPVGFERWNETGRIRFPNMTCRTLAEAKDMR